MGIEPENEVKEIDLAICVIETIKKGEFSDDELNFAKIFQVKRIRQRDDSILSLSASDFYYRNVYGKTYDTSDLVQDIEKISKEDIIRCAETLILDTIYVLTKKEND
jgi:predicted Zn-dependent peptidase